MRYWRSIAVGSLCGREIVLVTAYAVGAAFLVAAEFFVDYPVWLDYLPLGLTFLFGVAIGRWWAVVVPLALLAASVPATGAGEALSAASSFCGATAVGVGVRLGVAQTRADLRALRRRTVAIVLAYAASVAGFMAYAATLDEGASAVVATVAFLVLQVVVGFALGRWRALFLVAILPLLAIPVPTPEDAYEPLPLWFALLIFSPFIAGLIAAGVGARKLGGIRWPVLR